MSRVRCKSCDYEPSEHDTLEGYCMTCAASIIKSLESKPPAGEFDWELVNEKTQDDIISITMDFVHNRASSGQIADRIAKRCDAVKDIYQAKIDRLEAELKAKDELLKKSRDCIRTQNHVGKEQMRFIKEIDQAIQGGTDG